jgi:tetratricopeptide (TPR) repeat protein
MVGGVGGKFDSASIMKNMTTLAGGASASVKTTQEGQQQIKKAGENLSQKLKGAEKSDEASKQEEAKKQKEKEKNEGTGSLGKEAFVPKDEKEKKDANMQKLDLLREQAKEFKLKGNFQTGKSVKPPGKEHVKGDKAQHKTDQMFTGTFQATAKDSKEAAQRSGAFQAAGGSDSEMEKKQTQTDQMPKFTRPSVRGKAQQIFTSHESKFSGKTAKPQKEVKLSEFNKVASTDKEEMEERLQLITDSTDMETFTSTAKESRKASDDAHRMSMELKDEHKTKAQTVTRKEQRDFQRDSMSDEKQVDSGKLEKIDKIKKSTPRQDAAEASAELKDFQKKTGISTKALKNSKEIAKTLVDEPDQTKKAKSTSMKPVKSVRTLHGNEKTAPMKDIADRKHLKPLAQLDTGKGGTELVETSIPEKNVDADLEDLKAEPMKTLEPKAEPKELKDVDKTGAEDISPETSRRLTEDAGTIAFYNNRGTDCMKSGQDDAALAAFDMSLAVDPNDSFAKEQKAKILSKRADTDKSNTERAKTSAFYNNRGTDFISAGRGDLALESFNDALKVDPNDSFALDKKASILSAQRKFDEAVTCYDKILERNPKNTDALVGKAMNMTADYSSYNEGMVCLDRAISIDPSHVGAWQEKGALLEKMGKYAEADQCFQKADSLKNVNAGNNVSNEAAQQLASLNGRGMMLLRQGNFQDAKACIDEALRMDPNNVDAKYNSVMFDGVAAHRAQRPQDALTLYDQAIALNPGKAEGWYSKGLALEQYNRPQEALDCYNKALERNPEYASAWKGKGTILKAMGNMTEADQCFRCASMYGGQSNNMTSVGAPYCGALYNAAPTINPMALNAYYNSLNAISMFSSMMSYPMMGMPMMPFFGMGGMGMGMGLGMGMGSLGMGLGMGLGSIGLGMGLGGLGMGLGMGMGMGMGLGLYPMFPYF